MMAHVELNGGGSRLSAKRLGRKQLKTQELGDENMGARRNADPQMALGGHFSLTSLIWACPQIIVQHHDFHGILLNFPSFITIKCREIYHNHGQKFPPSAKASKNHIVSGIQKGGAKV